MRGSRLPAQCRILKSCVYRAISDQLGQPAENDIAVDAGSGLAEQLLIAHRRIAGMLAHVRTGDDEIQSDRPPTPASRLRPQRAQPISVSLGARVPRGR